MRFHFAVASLLSFMAFDAFAGMSHRRLGGETHEQAFARYAAERETEGLTANFADDSAYAIKTQFSSLDVTEVPAWESLEALTEAFMEIRDKRHLETTKRPGFARRISWLYPDDGCFARAAMARQHLEDESGHQVRKIFIFGNLRVETPNAPGGAVDWAWHVVPVARVGETLYAIDPAIEPAGPITVKEWALRQVPQLGEAEFSLCSSHSYSPYSRCLSSDRTDEDEADEDQRMYLDLEWDRLESLGRDPVKELGDQPPWLGARSPSGR